MKHPNLIYSMLLLLLTFCFQGCSDDLSEPSSRPDVEITYNGIVLRIPDPKGLAAKTTRAASDAEYIDIVEREGLITSLHLYAFPAWGNATGGPIHVDLKEIYEDESSDDLLLPGTADEITYRDFDITDHFKGNNGEVRTGPWKLYLVANLEHYTANGTLPSINSENDLKNIPLSFFASNGDYRLSADYIDQNGLPMACLPEGILHGTSISDLSPATNGLVNFPVAGEGVVLANLSFLCAKVRYTLFFDKESEGSAKEIFKGMSIDFTQSEAANILADGSSVGADLSATKSNLTKTPLSPLTLSECVYPDNAADYPETGEEFKPLPTLEEKSTQADATKRAWQGVLYLPENGSASSTTLSFLANAVKTKTENGKEILTEEKGSELSYSISLLPEVRDNSTTVKRGFAYDLVARVTKVDNVELKMDVAPWTALSLEYALTPPAFLHVDKTAVSVQAGHKTELWYESNAVISFDIPKYNGIPIYTITKEGNKIEVGVNSALPTSAFEEIKKEGNLGKYDFFHIVAGNIRKKIDVTPLLLQKFLIVDPQNFSIDVREQKASGRYSGDFYVRIETNIEKFRITDVSWLTGNPDRGEDLKIYINSADGGWEELKFGNDGEYKPINGQRQLKISYNNLNSGSSFWNTRQTFELTVSVDNGDTKPGPGYISPETVSATVLPANDNYIIHFRDNKNWSNVHIYVYQCLEMPSYWNKEHNGYHMASMPVGYEDRSNGDWDIKVMAALEYSFTGAIAFKGWESQDNNRSLNDYGAGWYNEGFWIFSDGKFYKDQECSWNPNHKLSDGRYEKGSVVDFCKEYRRTVSCDKCRNGTGNPSWPGIRMRKDADGWWTFELTGIATPGKALIMFTDGHDGDEHKANYKWEDDSYKWDDNHGRYPDDLKVGIPLFDYPSREGWFDLGKNNNNFISTKPTSNESSPISYLTRYYFDNSQATYEQPYIYLYNSAGNTNGSWPGEKMTYDVETGYWYCDVNINGVYDHVVFNPGYDQGKTGDLAVDHSKNLYDKDGAKGNVDENSGNQGGNESAWDNKSYRLYVKPDGNENNAFDSWIDGGGSIVKSLYSDTSKWTYDNGYYYHDFEYTGDFTLKWQTVYNAWEDNGSISTNNWDWCKVCATASSAFSYDNVIGKKCYTITGKETGKSGKP